jgi:glutamine amidotransferase
MIVIVDYDMGNVGSVFNMFKKIGIQSKVSSNLIDIDNASKLVLPGVGAFDSGMQNLSQKNLISILNKKVLIDKIPILGICLGMQLMTSKSEEGSAPGLGWFDAQTVQFKFDSRAGNIKIPHMGWNFITIKKDSMLLEGMGKDYRFYFVHSYHTVCNREEDILATTSYGYDFVSAINKDNIYGVQFHPEKSHKFGMKLFKNFAGL